MVRAAAYVATLRGFPVPLKASEEEKAAVGIQVGIILMA